uniref:Uncharacterized protein n=1 Tax=Arundo donax TaxID=35708 RepID=A0A0A9AQS9_ARUDO
MDMYLPLVLGYRSILAMLTSSDKLFSTKRESLSGTTVALGPNLTISAKSLTETGVTSLVNTQKNDTITNMKPT